MKNGERHSLARIPLRWMIRECFKVNTGIIFDAHMARNEVGLDMGDASPLPIRDSLSSTRESLVEEEHKSLWQRLKDTFGRIMDNDKPSLERFISNSERQEELDDALRPIYDQYDKHIYWKVMDYIPCEFSPSNRSCRL